MGGRPVPGTGTRNFQPLARVRQWRGRAAYAMPLNQSGACRGEIAGFPLKGRQILPCSFRIEMRKRHRFFFFPIWNCFFINGHDRGIVHDCDLTRRLCRTCPLKLRFERRCYLPYLTERHSDWPNLETRSTNKTALSPTYHASPNALPILTLLAP